MTNISVVLWVGQTPIQIQSEAVKPADMAKDIKAALLPKEAEFDMPETEARESLADYFRKRANQTAAFGRLDKTGYENRAITMQKVYARLKEYPNYPITLLNAIRQYRKAAANSMGELHEAHSKLSKEITAWGGLSGIKLLDIEPFVAAYSLLFN